MFYNAKSSSIKKSFLTISFIAVVASVNLTRNSYPLIFGFIVANIVQAYTCLYLSQYLLTKRLCWNSWDDFRLTSYRQVFAYTVGALVGSLLGALCGATALTIKYNHSMSFFYLTFRWFGSVSSILGTLVPFLLMLRDIRSYHFKFVSKRTLIVFLCVCILPIPIWVTKSRFNQAYSILVGLYLDLPLVLGIYIYGGILIGSFVMLLMTTICILMFYIVNTVEDGSVVEQRMAAITVFLAIMAFTSLIISSMGRERKATLESVEEEVRLRTRELSSALAELKAAKQETERISQQKSEFMVSVLAFHGVRAHF